MNFRSLLLEFALSAAFVLVSVPAQASISYTCDPNVDATQAGTCSYLNTTIAGIYGSTFTNADASIYIQYGTTSLGQSEFDGAVTSYSNYRGALIAADGPGVIRSDAVASLPGSEPSVYGGGDVFLTAALASSLGFNVSGSDGTTAAGASCANPEGSANGCYDGVITISNSQPLYYRQNGGTISGQYDYYGVVEHETDEVLGTASCISTMSSVLVDGCGGGAEAAVDLFRYNGTGSRAADTLYAGDASAPSGAYFSYNGGVSNGANGAVYNTVANGLDYADYVTSCQFVQDASGCANQIFDISTDGGAETNILDAIGYDLAVPEPGTFALLGAGFAFLLSARARRQRNREA